MKNIIETFMDMDRVLTEIENKKKSIYEKQKEIKLLNYQISELKNTMNTLWGPMGIKSGELFNILNNANENEKIEEITKIMDYFEERENNL